ncbi:MAG: cbb3-type cytochrome oxidase assembly protein CcoS [Bdellovibrionota bacterium]
MSVIFLLLPISLFLAVLFLVAYFWSVRSGQFDDLETPAMRILNEESQEEPTVEEVVEEREGK